MDTLLISFFANFPSFAIPTYPTATASFLQFGIIVMSNIVLVTGATGLLGRQVFNVFQHSGCLVVGQGYSRATPPTIMRADLGKPEDIDRLLDEAK